MNNHLNDYNNLNNNNYQENIFDIVNERVRLLTEEINNLKIYFNKEKKDNYEKLDNIKKEKSLLEKEIKELKSSKLNLEKNNSKLKQEIKELRINNTQLQEENKQIKEMSNKLKIENDNKIIKLNNEIDNLKISLKNKKSNSDKWYNYWQDSQEENKKIKNKIQLLKKENEEINNSYNQLKETNKNLNNLIDDIENNIENGNLIKEYIKIKNLIDKLIKIKETKNIEIIDLNKKLNIELEKEKNKNIDLQKEIENIKKQKNISFENYKKNDYNEKYINKQLEDFYDVIINIKSISSLTKPEGWPIKWNKNRKDIYERFKNKVMFKIGVLGNGNVGKSFLLSRLFKTDIPYGYSVNTEGLSLKYNENGEYIILDTVGFQTPLIKDDDYLNTIKDEKLENKNEIRRKKYENLYIDKTQTENFIQNLIIHESDMLLIVVGKLTFNEQRLINKIKKEIELGLKDYKGKNKSLYIIHNLMNFQTKNQVEEHIKNTILKSASFNIKEIKDITIGENETNIDNKEGKRVYLVENDNDFEVYHLIMSREETEAGNYYNNYTYELLKQGFSLFTRRKPLAIIDEVKDRFIEWSNDLLEEKINYNDIEIVKDEETQKEIKYIFKGEENQTENKIEDQYAIQTDNKNENKSEKKKLIPKAYISDELGLSIYRSNGYEPPYYFYIDSNGKEEKLIIVLEIPGGKSIDEVYADTDTKEIIVKGSKNDKNNNVKILYNKATKFGKFNLHIPYGNKIQLADGDPIEGEDSYEYGIYTFKFRLIKKRKYTKKKI